MNKWKILFYRTASGREPVKEFINKLADKNQAKILHHIDLLKQYGLSLRQPYLKRVSGTSKLWELRPGVYRIFLSAFPQSKILLVHMIIKKSQKTPKKDLKLAEKRLKEYL